MVGSSRLFILVPVLALFGASPAYAVSRDDVVAANQPKAQPAPAERKSYMNRMELAVHALAATCVRHPKGIGLAETVAPGKPFSLPQMSRLAARRLSATPGSQGWILPEVLGQAALILRPDGSCSVLIRQIAPQAADKTLKGIFSRLENLRLKYLDKKVCNIGGIPTTTTTYSMIPSNAEHLWGKPEIRRGRHGHVRSERWRGFMLAVASQNHGSARHSMVMTTYVGQHVVGQGCGTGHSL